MLKHVNAQRNFSAGEVDDTFKRDDDLPQFKMGLRQCQNFRITDTNKLTNRLGRSVKFIDGPRVDEVLMSPGNIFYLIFGNGKLSVRNAAGAVVFTTTLKGDGATAIPWTTATAPKIVWDVYQFSIYIAYADGFPNNIPQVLTWDGVSQASTWTLTTFAELIAGNGQKRTPFLRLSPLSVTMQPSAAVGSVTLTFNQPIAVAGMVGTRMQYCGQQVLITAFIDTTHLTASVIQTLPPGQTLTLTSTVGSFSPSDVVLGATSGASAIVVTSPTVEFLGFTQASVNPNPFAINIGDHVTGNTSGATGIVTLIQFFGGGGMGITVALSTGTLFTVGENLTGPAWTVTGITQASSGTMTVQLLQNANGLVKGFSNGEVIAGPSGQATIGAIPTSVAPQAVSIWLDEVINQFRGYPSSVFIDQGRLGFCNFTAVKNGIVWSAIGTFTDLFTVATPAGSIFELAPNKSQVLYVAAGMQSSEFVFCDNALYEIPINQTNPLSGAAVVAFNKLSDDGCAPIQPRRMQNTIIYVNAGGKSVRAIMTTGAYYRANESRDISQYHNHMINNPVAIACPTADDPNFPERYFYVLNGDGTLAVGKIDVQDGQIRQGTLPGWVRESGNGSVAWISARGGNVMFTTALPGNVTVAELRDFTQFVDAGLFYNNVPAALAAPLGKGPLWWLPSSTVTVMDQNTRQMGLYSVDANGFLIPQNQGGENLASAQLVVGQAWTATAEPFAPSVEPGQDMDQRMTTRQIAQAACYFSNSTGFIWQRLFAGPLRRGGPALGAVQNTRRVTTYNQDDDATQPPPLRDGADIWRPSGKFYDPRIAIVKDTSGPLNILEIGMEISI